MLMLAIFQSRPLCAFRWSWSRPGHVASLCALPTLALTRSRRQFWRLCVF